MTIKERLLLSLLITLVGAALGAWLAARHFEPQLAAANTALGEFRNAYAALAEATARQNETIETERLAGEQRKKDAEESARRARGEAKIHYRKGQDILGIKPPPGVDPCIAARQAFDDELREERGQR